MLAARSSVGRAIWPTLLWCVLASGCPRPSSEVEGRAGRTDDAAEQEPRETMGFREDVDFLRQHIDVMVLHDVDRQSLVAVAPEYQGRVMTSSATGDQGRSFGWLNRELIASGERREHINAFGGEDRFWLGPEGGQFSIFFEPSDPFDLEHWQTPPDIDWGRWDLVTSSATQARFQKRMRLTNYSGTELELEVDRQIRLLSPDEVGELLGTIGSQGLSMGSHPVVAFESDNRLTNRGELGWKKDSGLLSVWILGMFRPSPSTIVIVPFRADESISSPIVNDAYFGKVPEERLRIGDGKIFFRGDGRFRSKIGLSRKRALPYLGSYDSASHVLTLVAYDLPPGAVDYVNSMWEIQAEPYGGDVVNSYNDGPPEPGVAPLGPFYELETSSPAMELEPGASLSHRHRTVHVQLRAEDADEWLGAIFNTSLAELEGAFPE